MSTRRLVRLATLAALAVVAAPVALHASSITYDVTLSPSMGAIGGTGQLVLSSAPSATGVAVYSGANHSLEDLSFTLDGKTFSLAGDPTATVEFLNGKLWDITFAQTLGSGFNRYTLDTSGGYAFYYDGLQHEAAGSFSAIPQGVGDPAIPDTPQPPPSPQTSAATPEPESLVLLGTGLCFLAAMVVRRGNVHHRG